MFHNRVTELSYLEELEKKTEKAPKLLVIYGRRRTGKTTLIREFLKRKKGIYLFIETKNEDLILKEAEELFGRHLGYVPKIDTWEVFFKLAFENKLMIVMDEFQNFQLVNPNVFTKFQKLWDAYSAQSGILWVAIGSYVGMMKKIFQDAKQPLFGRADGLLNLRPFDFVTTYEFLKNQRLELEKAVEIYSVLGGIPKYLSLVESPKTYLHDIFYSQIAPLRDEGKNILVLEFGSEHRGYFSILEAVSNGKRVPGEIADYTGLKPDTVGKYLSELTTEYGMLEKAMPSGTNNKKAIRYFINDKFYNFWFRFVYSRMSEIEIDPDNAYRKMLDELPSHIGKAVESIIREIIVKNGKPLKPNNIGSWWNRKGEEIDIVAVNDKKRKILFVEIKWQNKSVGADTLNELQRKSELVEGGKKYEKNYLLVSKAGFRDAERLRGANVELWDLKRIADVIANHR